MATIKLESVAYGHVVTLDDDGSCRCETVEQYGYNGYLHFINPEPCESDDLDESSEPYMPTDPPTEAQRRTLARWYLHIERAVDAPLGSPVCRWAFAGLGGPQGVSDHYGNGGAIPLTAPTDERERIIRSPRRAGTDDDRPSEAAIASAVEDGSLAGASPANV